MSRYVFFVVADGVNIDASSNGSNVVLIIALSNT